MNRKDFMDIYWRYYLLLENSFIETGRYVEFNEKNYAMFSVEYAKQLQTICAELDQVFKLVSRLKLEDSHNIKEYCKLIKEKYPDIVTQQVRISKKNIVLTPFDGWKDGRTLNWWQCYNKVKHNRSQNMEEASLRNVLFALGALFTIEIIYIKDICTENKDEFLFPDHPSSLFGLVDWPYYQQLIGDNALY